MKFNTVRFKISVLYTAILGVIIIIYSSILYTTLRFNLYQSFDRDLLEDTQEIVHAVGSYLDIIGREEDSFEFSLKKAINLEAGHAKAGKIEELQRLWLKRFNALGLADDYINFWDSEERLIASSSNVSPALLSIFSKNKEALLGKKENFRNIKFKNSNLRLISFPFSFKADEQYIIQIGRSLEEVAALMKTRLYYRLIPIPVVLFFGFFVGRVFASRILRPVMEITKTAKNITYKDLSTRVETENIDEEMRYLVDAFNDMISRLEKSFKYIAEFSSHVAHELKTPLAIIRGESEVTLRKERKIEEYQSALKANLEEVQRMLKIIEDLLLLTRAEYSPKVFKFEQVELMQFLREIHEQSKVLASGKDIKITLDVLQEPVAINADRLHLRRLFFNLIENAIKFTPKGGRIDIKAGRQDKKAVVTVSDTGVGITEENLPKVFNKFFYQAKKSPHISSGSGLGLSIVQSIAKLHNGNVTVKSRPDKGSTFSLILPLS